MHGPSPYPYSVTEAAPPRPQFRVALISYQGSASSEEFVRLEDAHDALRRAWARHDETMLGVLVRLPEQSWSPGTIITQFQRNALLETPGSLSGV